MRYIHAHYCFQMGESSRISANIHFHQHVSISGKRALSFKYYVQRLSSYEHSQMSIFSCFVLSNFSSLVWNFSEAAHTCKMERTVLCHSFTTINNCLPIPTLELHHKREILEEVYKSVNNISTCFMWNLFKIKDANFTYEITEMCV